MVKRVAILACIFSFYAATVFAGTHSGTICLSIAPAVSENSKKLKLWVPYPLSDRFQTISNVQIDGNQSTSGVYREPATETV